MKKPYFKISIGIGIGAMLGFAYFYFIGCRTGACPITSNPFISTAYGAAIGLLLTLGNSKTRTKEESQK